MTNIRTQLERVNEAKNFQKLYSNVALQGPKSSWENMTASTIWKRRHGRKCPTFLRVTYNSHLPVIDIQT